MAQLICEVACRVDGSSGHRVIWAGLVVRNVKVLMTVINCQLLLYDVLFAGSCAPCGAPASRVAIQASTALTLLRRKHASAGLARSRRGDVRHDLTSGYFRAFSWCHVIIESCRNEEHGNGTSTRGRTGTVGPLPERGRRGLDTQTPIRSPRHGQRPHASRKTAGQDIIAARKALSPSTAFHDPA